MEGVARGGSEQHAAAAMPCCHKQTRQRGVTDQRPVVGGTGSAPGERLDQLELGDLGHDLDRGAQQMVSGTGRHGEVGPDLFHGCSDNQLTVAAGNEVDLLPVNRRADGALHQPDSSCQPQDLALNRADRVTRAIREPGNVSRAVARRQDDQVGIVDRRHPRGQIADIDAANPDRSPVNGDQADPLAMDPHTGALGCSEQCTHDQAVVDAVVARDLEGRTYSRRERGLQRARLTGAQSVVLQVMTGEQVGDPPQADRVVGVEADPQRALFA